MKRRKWIYVAVVAVAMVIAIRVYTSPLTREGHRQQREFDATFRQYSSAIMARDYSAAYSLGGQEFRRALSEPDFVAEQRSLETKWGGLESSSVEGFHIDGQGDPMEWRATVRELRHYKNGNLHLLYEFRIEDGRWKLFGYQERD